MNSSWQREARRDLIARRGPSTGWSYRAGHAPSVEPTVMACLALAASGDEHTAQSDLEICKESAQWLAAVQRADGSLPVAAGMGSPAGWPTPYGVLLWSMLDAYRAQASRAERWLLASAGRPISVDKNATKVIGHNPHLVGWPWVEATHSWLEPTALAILALCRPGLAGHPRARAGVKVILDRALDSGGWNYGNKSVFGTELRPQPGPTGLALLALAAAKMSSPVVGRGLSYLQSAVVSLRAPVSLGWAILGLRAHDVSPADANERLAHAASRCANKPDAVIGLALALLASSQPALGYLISRSAANSDLPLYAATADKTM